MVLPALALFFVMMLVRSFSWPVDIYLHARRLWKRKLWLAQKVWNLPYNIVIFPLLLSRIVRS
jgi:hypothetical protein